MSDTGTPLGWILLVMVVAALFWLSDLQEQPPSEHRLRTGPALELLRDEVDHQQTVDRPPKCWPYVGPPSDGADMAFSGYVGSLERDTQQLEKAVERLELSALHNPRTGFTEYRAFEASWGQLTAAAQDAVDACLEFWPWAPRLIDRHLSETHSRLVAPAREACHALSGTWPATVPATHCEPVDAFTSLLIPQPDGPEEVHHDPNYRRIPRP